jgi:hypothetical protein
MGGERLSLEGLDHHGNAGAFMTHRVSLNGPGGGPKRKVTGARAGCVAKHHSSKSKIHRKFKFQGSIKSLSRRRTGLGFGRRIRAAAFGWRK